MAEIKMEENFKKSHHSSIRTFRTNTDNYRQENPIRAQIKNSYNIKEESKMGDQEDEHEIMVEETPIENVEIDPSTLTPTSPEVISR
jgi:hypothetical protein